MLDFIIIILMGTKYSINLFYYNLTSHSPTIQFPRCFLVFHLFAILNNGGMTMSELFFSSLELSP